MKEINPVKIITLLGITWFFTLLAIWRFDNKHQLEDNNDNMLIDDRQKYEDVLKKIELMTAKKNKNSHFGAKFWRNFGERGSNSSLVERYSILRNTDIPPGIVTIITMLGIICIAKIQEVKLRIENEGMNGKPVFLADDKEIPLNLLWFIRKGWQEHAFNDFVSDLIPLNRTLPDVRDEWCKIQNYSTNLPQASVVICFHNEAWSTLLRTIHSVLDRSPENLLKEIILVDDFSDMKHLQTPLDDYVNKHLRKVSVIRANERLGLIRARLLGLKFASAPVVLYLDSHCECTEGWLEPLLDRIEKDQSKVVSPVIDYIHKNTFEYIYQDIDDLRLGGFDWNLRFMWEVVPTATIQSRQYLAAPINTPVIAGGLFAIDKQFFARLGYYDEEFNIWGSENLELSFKTWMCGGTLEIIPCSHVGHVFRRQFPYKGAQENAKRNAVRLAKVWLDEYAKYFFDRIGNHLGEYGNVDNRMQLKQKLKCKSFEWYLKKVYPYLSIPNDLVGSGRLYSLNNEMMCLDADTSSQNFQPVVNVFICHYHGGNQYWAYTKHGQIKRNDYCMTYMMGIIGLDLCNAENKNQIWYYNNSTKQIINMGNYKCLRTIQLPSRQGVTLEACSGTYRQKWAFEYLRLDKLDRNLGIALNNYNIMYKGKF